MDVRYSGQPKLFNYPIFSQKRPPGQWRDPRHLQGRRSGGDFELCHAGVQNQQIGVLDTKKNCLKFFIKKVRRQLKVHFSHSVYFKIVSWQSALEISNTTQLSKHNPIRQKCAISQKLSEDDQLTKPTQLAETSQLGEGEAFSGILIVDCGCPFFLDTRSVLWISESTGERLYKICETKKTETLSIVLTC